MASSKPEVTKASFRQKIWDHLEKTHIAEFPRPVHHRIPNFKGAAVACDQACSLDVFKKAQTVKINPDKPQEQARFHTLEAGKTLLVPTPRLAEGLFNRIVPPKGEGKESLRVCASSQGVKEYSVPVGLDSKVKIDLIIIGSVAVSPKGWRLGKGEGYADMEYAMMVAMGAVGPETLVVTTVHDCQVLDDLPDELFSPHDLTVDIIVTPTRVIQCEKKPKPTGIVWSILTTEKFKAIPVLQILRDREREKGVDVTLKNEGDGDVQTQKCDSGSGNGVDANRNSSEEHCTKESDEQGKQEPDKPQPYKRLPSVYVGHLPRSYRVSALKVLLRERDVHPIRLIWKGARGFAFLLLQDIKACEKAVEMLQGLEVDGRILKVEVGSPRSHKSQKDHSVDAAAQKADNDSGDEAEEKSSEVVT